MTTSAWTGPGTTWTTCTCSTRTLCWPWGRRGSLRIYPAWTARKTCGTSSAPPTPWTASWWPSPRRWWPTACLSTRTCLTSTAWPCRRPRRIFWSAAGCSRRTASRPPSARTAGGWSASCSPRPTRSCTTAGIPRRRSTPSTGARPGTAAICAKALNFCRR